jgi:hypothetical protein
MNGMKFNLVEAFLQLASPTVVDFVDCTLWRARAPNNPARRKSRDHQHRISIDGDWLRRGCESAPDYRFAGAGELAATLVSAGVAAILTSTSLTGFSVQACVT